MKLLIKIFNILILILVLISCEDPEVIRPNPLKFGNLQNDSINKRETIVVFGENMGVKPNGMCILIDSNYILGADSILIWNNSKIEFIPPQFTGAHTFNIITNKDTSNKYNYFLKAVRDIDFVSVDAGEFIMGSESGLENEKPAHKVIIPNALLVSKFEINQDVYLDVCDTNPSIFKDRFYPVHNIDWIDAIKFCNKLSELKGFNKCYNINGGIVQFDTLANGFRLASEAEWEYLCRGNTKGDFNLDETNINDIAWYNMNSGYNLKESGKLLPNKFGIFDMHGNVWEWCWDYHIDDYYSKKESYNPLGPKNGINRVLRGGSYISGKTEIRSSSRKLPSDMKSHSGIRIVKNIQ